MSIDRTELCDAVRKAFGENGLAPDAAKSWDQFVEMGFLGLTVPEDKGGLGLGHEALAAIHYELGRALVPGAAIAQMVAIEALVASGQSDMLNRAMAGEKVTVSSLGFMDADMAPNALFLGCDQISLCPVIEANHHQTWDETRRLFGIRWDEKSQILADGEDADGVFQRAMSTAMVAIAADSLGGADAALSMTLDYLQTRKQFDRPLAMFQALKHRVADLKIALVSAEALLWSHAAGASSLQRLGALKAHATQVYRTIAEEAIQLHGGIALTQEHHCHLFLKRAMLNAVLGGDADMWEELAGREALKGH